MTHYTIECGALIHIMWCITYYLCSLGSISGFISFYCTPLSPIYRKDIFSFQSSQQRILSCVLGTLCKEVPPSKRIDIYLYYSLLRCVFLSYCILCSFYAIFGTWLHNIWYQSSFLDIGFFKMSHLGILFIIFFYKVSEYQTQQPSLKKNKLSVIQVLDPKTLQIRIYSTWKLVKKLV